MYSNLDYIKIYRYLCLVKYLLLSMLKIYCKFLLLNFIFIYFFKIFEILRFNIVEILGVLLLIYLFYK